MMPARSNGYASWDYNSRITEAHTVALKRATAVQLRVHVRDRSLLLHLAKREALARHNVLQLGSKEQVTHLGG